MHRAPRLVPLLLLVACQQDDLSARSEARSSTARELTEGPTIFGSEEDDQIGWVLNMGGDLDGDGYDDLAMGLDRGFSGVGAAMVVPGSADGPDQERALLIESEDGDLDLGRVLSIAGDLNGDGYDDLVIGAYTADAGGQLRVHFGGPDGVATAPDQVLEGTEVLGEGARSFGYNVLSAGDLDGDGFGDLLVLGFVGEVEWEAGVAVLALLRGSAEGLGTEPVATWRSSSTGTDYFGQSLAVGDLDGDGLPELVIGAPESWEGGGAGSQGRVDIYRGVEGGFEAEPALVLWGVEEELTGLGSSLALPGDLDGDGFNDLAIGGYIGHDDRGGVYLYRGSKSLVETSPFQTLLGETPVDWVGYSLIGPGDLDGDGYPDLVAGAPAWNYGGSTRPTYLCLGAALAMFGAEGGPDLEDRLLLSGVDHVAYFGAALAAGDINGDGAPDLVIGAPFQDTDEVEHAGAVSFHFGTPPEPEPEPEPEPKPGTDDGGSEDEADGDDSKGKTGCCQATPGAAGLLMALLPLLAVRRRREA